MISTFLVLFVIVIIFVYIARDAIRTFRQWRSLPTFERYVAEHPLYKTNRGITCHNCKSNSIRNWGLRAAADLHRIHICNHCGTRLYRTGP